MALPPGEGEDVEGLDVGACVLCIHTPSQPGVNIQPAWEDDGGLRLAAADHTVGVLFVGGGINGPWRGVLRSTDHKLLGGHPGVGEMSICIIQSCA